MESPPSLTLQEQEAGLVSRHAFYLVLSVVKRTYLCSRPLISSTKEHASTSPGPLCSECRLDVVTWRQSEIDLPASACMCVVHIKYGKDFIFKQACGLLKIMLANHHTAESKERCMYIVSNIVLRKGLKQGSLHAFINQEIIFSSSSVNPIVSEPAGWFSATFLWPDVLKLTKRDLPVIILCGAASDTRDTCCHWQHIYSLSLHISQQANWRILVISSNWMSPVAVLFLLRHGWMCAGASVSYKTLTSSFIPLYSYIRSSEITLWIIILRND